MKRGDIFFYYKKCDHLCVLLGNQSCWLVNEKYKNWKSESEEKSLGKLIKKYWT